MPRHLHVALLAVAVTASACASSGHTIPRRELMALSQLPPEQRGERVRVVQNLGGDDSPPDAPHAHVGIVVVTDEPVWVDGTPRHDHSGPAPVNHHPHAGVPAGGSNLAGAKKENAKALLVVAAVVAGALALTEGTRYDGWVRINPMQPVHLWGPYGEYTWMPLAQVTPQVAQWARKAMIRPEEGPWQLLGRAPLDRQGWTYSVLLGSSEIALIGADPKAGFLGHIDIGYYLSQVVGLQLDLGYGWTQDDLGATIFEERAGLELDVLPLSAGNFHAGVFGGLGASARNDDGIQFDDTSNYLSAGGLAQLELTTRLALTLRAGLTMVYGERLSELTAGVSIY
jgi:hypothetical protein